MDEDIEQLLARMTGRVEIARPPFYEIQKLSEVIQLLTRRRIPLSKWGKGKAKDCASLFQQLVTDDEARLFEWAFKKRKRLHRYIRVLLLRLVYDVPPGTVVHDTSPYVLLNEDTLIYRPCGPVEPRPLTERCLLVQYAQHYGEGPIKREDFSENLSETLYFTEHEFLRAAVRAWLEELGVPPTPEELDTLRSMADFAVQLGIGKNTSIPVPGLPLEPNFVRYGPTESDKYPGTLTLKDLWLGTMTVSTSFNPNGYVEKKPKKTVISKWVPISQLQAIIA